MIPLLLLSAAFVQAASTAQEPLPPLKVLTFNVAGIPVIHPGWPRRRKAIAESLKSSSYDLVALQEIWLNADARLLARDSGFPFHYRSNPDGIIGDGLLFLSRYPILDTGIRTFRCYPPGWHKAYQGENVANKGVVLVRVETPRGPLDVYNTHLVADYPSSIYSSVRQAQVFELYEFVQENSSGKPFLILGDINSGPGEAGYRALTGLLNLGDACSASGRDTCPSSHAKEGKRIDHILFPAGKEFPVSAKPVFTGTLPGGQAYSDHAGISATLGWELLSRKQDFDPVQQRTALTEMRRRLEEFTHHLAQRSTLRAWIPIYGLFHQARYDLMMRRHKAVLDRVEGLLCSPRAFRRVELFGPLKRSIGTGPARSAKLLASIRRGACYFHPS